MRAIRAIRKISAFRAIRATKSVNVVRESRAIKAIKASKAITVKTHGLSWYFIPYEGANLVQSSNLAFQGILVQSVHNLN